MSDGHGVFGKEAELPKNQYNVYCPLLDCGDSKRTDKLNYFKLSCDDRIKDHLCNYRGECKFKESTVKKIENSYRFMGLNYVMGDNKKWSVVTDAGAVISKGLHNLERCKTIIRNMRLEQGGYESLEN